MTIDNAITVVSSHTVDHLPDGTDLPGGPARYIGDALDRLGVPWHLITGVCADVTVIPAEDGQRYDIHPLPRIAMPCKLEGPAVILSPIVREIDPSSIPPVDGILAVDLQGFVRRPNTIKLDQDVDLTALIQRADVVKGTEDEIDALCHHTRQALARTTVLVTGGSLGTALCVDGREELIAANPIDAAHTIGAGDTYLAAYVVALVESGDPRMAAERAARFTEDILATRR